MKWGDYYALEPWGEWRGDVRSAQICAVLANVNRDPEKKPDPFQINDFMLFNNEPKPERNEDDVEVDPTLMTWLFAVSHKPDGVDSR